MRSGVIILDDLYEFARRCPLTRNDKTLREFGKLCKSCTDGIEESQGFYLWGRYTRQRLWKSIYLGKGGVGKEADKKANLKKRILEELKTERCIFWRVKHSDRYLLSLGKRLYRKFDWKRALRKTRATHIVWVSMPHLEKENDIERVEADLIEALNPTANDQRPVPPSTWQQDTSAVFKEFRRHIHQARPRDRVLKIELVE